MADPYTLADLLQGPSPPTLAGDSIRRPTPRPEPSMGPLPPPSSGESFASWLVSQGMPRWQADRIGAVVPYTPPGAAFDGGRRVGAGLEAGDPLQVALGYGQTLAASLPITRPWRYMRIEPTPPPAGPWVPGYMERWLADRYQPAARPQPWQTGRRWGSDEAPLSWGDVVAGRINRMDFDKPLDPRLLREIAKGSLAAGTAGGLGGGVGQYLTDRYWHGRPASEAAWRAMTAGPYSDPPPDWWPQPQSREGERAIPSTGPQPPSMLRSGW